jgi:hypothetical protein
MEKMLSKRFFVVPLNVLTREVLDQDLSFLFEYSEQRFWNGCSLPAWESSEPYVVELLARKQTDRRLKFMAFIQQSDQMLYPCPFKTEDEYFMWANQSC